MKLFLIYQNVNQDYDTYDAAVVAAPTAKDARYIHPSENYVWHNDDWYFKGYNRMHKAFSDAWCHPDNVTVQALAEYKGEAGVILASFNAG